VDILCGFPKNLWKCCMVFRNIYGNVVLFSENFMEMFCGPPKYIWKCLYVFRNLLRSWSRNV
jgi:hypothetical protein